MKTSTSWQQLQPSYIREILVASQQPGVISLAGGLPASDLLPVEFLRPHIEELALHPELFQYGSSTGLNDLRQELHNRYSLSDDADLIITSGSQQGLDIIARTFLDRNSAVALEAPCYLGALQVFQLSETRICPVNQTTTGPELTALEQLFKDNTIRLFYAVPDFHNPTGVCWTLETRLAVINLCRRFGVYLLEDSPYRDLRFSGEPIPALSQLAPDITLQLNSFSKTVAPGLRLGAISGPGHLIEQLQQTRQAMDLHSPVPFQQVLLKFMKSQDYPRHLSELRRAYRNRYTALSDNLKDKLGGQIKFSPVEGGMFLWLTLQQDTEIFAQRALVMGVATVPGCHFYPQDHTADNQARRTLRLNFSHGSIEQLAEAVDRIKLSLQ